MQASSAETFAEWGWGEEIYLFNFAIIVIIGNKQ